MTVSKVWNLLNDQPHPAKMEWGEQSFYHSKPNSDISATEIPDQRKLPVNYPQSGGGRDLSTGCRVDGHHRDDAGNLQCKWGKPSSFNKDRCMYLKFGYMCDKVLDSEGKEIN